MYLETRGGPASISTIDNSLSTGSTSDSLNKLNFSGTKSGQFTAGWTLPRGRGQYLLTYTGVADGTFELDATGMQKSYQNSDGTGGTKTIGFELPWWQVTVRDGQLTTTKTPPVWNSFYDQLENGGNSNGEPDPNEIRYPTPTVNLSATVPKSLGNRVQTWDLCYRREFGGVKIRSRWTAGIRYLTFDGAIATPAWVTGTSSTGGFGYTDGTQLDLILMQQKTSGFGPVGSGEIQFNFFRQRLTLYALVQAALILESLETDSGTFTFLSRSTTVDGYFVGAGRIQNNVSKSTWNTTFEAGVRVKLLEGFHLIVDWNTTGYLDTMLIPTDLSIPDNASQVDTLGTTARFISRDFVVSSINLGLSFQF